MVFTTKTTYLLGGVLGVLVFLQGELSIPHWIHLGIAAAVVFLSAIGIKNINFPTKETYPEEFEGIPTDQPASTPDQGNHRG